MTKVIDSVISIDTFEQQWVVLKGMLQSPQLKDHVQTIGIDQYIRYQINNNTCPFCYKQNIKKLFYIPKILSGMMQPSQKMTT